MGSCPVKYPMKCPDCGYETDSKSVPIEQGPPAMYCLLCALITNDPRLVRMRRVFTAAPAIFRGGGWASKS